MATTTELDLQADIIDVRDIIARIEELESERDAFETIDYPVSEYHAMAWLAWSAVSPDEAEELDRLTEIMADIRGYGGDEQWRGDWYPITLIDDVMFQTYAEDLADELGLVNDNPQWPYTCIDWEQAARELREDYTSVSVAGREYWYR